MSTQFPLIRMRIPALQRQCLFLRYQSQTRPHNLFLGQTTISAGRAFSSTPSRPTKQRRLGTDRAQVRSSAAANIGPAPGVGFEQAQGDVETMQDDIGLLQNTMIRAPLRELSLLLMPIYFWKLIKSKGTALYSRYLYRSCLQKRGWTKFLPIDIFEWAQLKYIGRKHYEQLCKNLAEGTVDRLKDVCLPPLVKKLELRIAARGDLQMVWRLHGDISTRIVSHRASPLGEGHPDTAYRQLVIRCKSIQSLTRSYAGTQATSSSMASRRPSKSLAWMPDTAREQMQREGESVRKEKAESGMMQMQDRGVFVDNGVKKTVVEYLVLQKRVIRGQEEDWKIWGFAQESTPAIMDKDEKYWREVLDYQAGGAA